MALREIMTPNGPVLLSDEDAAAFGFAPEAPPQDFGAPVLPPPAESPVPDVAFAPPPPDAVSGAGAVVPDMAPRLTPGLADSGLTGGGPAQAGSPTPIAQETAPAAPQGQIPGGPAAGPEAPQEQASPPPPRAQNLSALSYGDIVAQQQGDLQAEAAAQQSVGDKEAASLEAQAAKMQQRDDALAARQAASQEKAVAEAAEIERKAQVWQAKNDEWMNAKVKRRGINTGEIISIAIAGLGSALKGEGAKNPALDVTMSNIQNDVDDQIRERDQLGKQASALKGSVDYAREIASDANAARMAAIGMEAQRYGREIETIAAKMQPGIKREQVKLSGVQLQQKGTEYLVQGKQHQDTIDQANANRAQQERESRRSTGLGYARLNLDAKQTDRAFAEQQRQFDLSNARAYNLAALDAQTEAAKLAAAGKGKEAEVKLANAKEERELAIGGGPMLKGGKAPNAAIQAMNKLTDKVGGKKIATPGFDEFGRLLQPDGSVFKAPDPVSAQALRKQVKATVTSSEMIDEVLRLREKYGWSSNLVKSDEWRAMQANKGAIIVEAKNAAELGALSGPDMDLIVSMMGTTDPTEFRDPGAGLQQMKKNMQASTRNALTTAGYAGDAFNVPDASSEPKAPKDADIADLVSEGARIDTSKGAAALHGGEQLTEYQADALSNLAARANKLRGPDGKVNPDAQAAVAGLFKAVSGAQNQAARDAAASTLVDLAAAGNPLAALKVDEIKRALSNVGKSRGTGTVR